jgi:hypothetical protein
MHASPLNGDGVKTFERSTFDVRRSRQRQARQPPPFEDAVIVERSNVERQTS